MQIECFRARHYLEDIGISGEVIDPIWLSPLDIDTIVASVMKTGRLIVVDNSWITCGASAEIAAQVFERLHGKQAQVHRMGFAPVTCPPTPTLEELFYPNARTIAAAACKMVTGGSNHWMPAERADLRETDFKGPF